MQPQIIIIAGPNGAGKSTLAPFLLRDRLQVSAYVNADTIAAGLAAFDPERVALEAGRIMLQRMHNLVKQRASFAFETTLATRSYAPWLRELMTQGYRVHLNYIWLRSPALAVERVALRVQSGGHNIPEATIRRRYEKGARHFFELYRPFVTAWAVYDNSVPPHPILLANGRTVEQQTSYAPELWAQFCEGATT